MLEAWSYLALAAFAIALFYVTVLAVSVFSAARARATHWLQPPRLPMNRCGCEKEQDTERSRVAVAPPKPHQRIWC